MPKILKVFVDEDSRIVTIITTMGKIDIVVETTECCASPISETVVKAGCATIVYRPESLKNDGT